MSIRFVFCAWFAAPDYSSKAREHSVKGLQNVQAGNPVHLWRKNFGIEMSDLIKIYIKDVIEASRRAADPCDYRSVD